MGFPAPVFSECEVPRLLLNFVFLLAHHRRLSSWLLRLVGAGVDDDLSFDHPTTSGITDYHRHHREQYDDYEERCIEELEKHSPAMRFDALSGAGDVALLLPEGCAVCLGNFHGAAHVRRPRGCTVQARVPPRLPRPLGRTWPQHLPALPGASPPALPPAAAASGAVIPVGCCLHNQATAVAES